LLLAHADGHRALGVRFVSPGITCGLARKSIVSSNVADEECASIRPRRIEKDLLKHRDCAPRPNWRRVGPSAGRRTLRHLHREVASL
jgi:hypothetical protein